jgi:hypothetical protein
MTGHHVLRRISQCSHAVDSEHPTVGLHPLCESLFEALMAPHMSPENRFIQLTSQQLR